MKNHALSVESHLQAAQAGRVAFPKTESQLSDRVREAIGEVSVAAFSRKCGIGDSVLRKYLGGAVPSTENMVAIADAANVSIEWLAAGRGPKQRVAALSAVAPPVVFDDLKRLSTAISAVEEGLRAIQRQLPPDRHAQLIAAAYDFLESPSTNTNNVIKFIKAAA